MRLIFVRNVATLLIGNARFCAPKEGGAWELQMRAKWVTGADFRACLVRLKRWHA
jgi:hypothetical protein